MFNGLFGSQTVQVDLKNEILTNAKQARTNNVIKLLNNNNINLQNSSILDDYGQNLLHIAVRSYNYDLAKYLIGRRIDKLKTNQFNEIPLDIAMKNHDKISVEILCENKALSPEIPILTRETKRLTEKINEVEENNKKLIEANTDLTHKNMGLVLKLDEEVRGRKRQRDEDDHMVDENKRLKSENNQLKGDNLTLRATVKTLRESLKQ